jgi:hypothetical protein
LIEGGRLSGAPVPPWVRLACKRWGETKRRIWSGADWCGNPDGYASSLLGRIRDERGGAAPNGVTQHWPEVFRGDGLAVQRAIHGLPEDPYDALHVKYVFDPRAELSAQEKAALLGLKERAYWESVGRAEYWIYARLDSKSHARAETLIASREKTSQHLPVRRNKAQYPSQSSNVAELSFAALQRTKLTLR